MSDRRLTEHYARQQMIKYKEGTREWLFWRGVCLGMEGSIHITEEWAESILHNMLILGRNK